MTEKVIQTKNTRLNHQLNIGIYSLDGSQTRKHRNFASDIFKLNNFILVISFFFFYSFLLLVWVQNGRFTEKYKQIRKGMKKFEKTFMNGTTLSYDIEFG